MAEVDEYLQNNHQENNGVVLYIEDNLANIKLVEAILSRIPMVKLVTAMQGHLAMDMAREHLPDLILLDVHLPDMNGADLLATLKQEPETKEIPVIVISADATSTQVHRLMELGARKYLTKPIVVKEFIDVINEALTAPKDKADE